MHAMLAGAVLALLLFLAGRWAWRILRRLARWLHRPWPRALPSRLRGLRLSRSRARACREGARAAALMQEVERLRVELRIARAERDAALGRARRHLLRRGGADILFQQAKRDFARRFYPDRLPPGARDRTLRVALFREYWEALRRIERGG
jgi:hypothetical protein